MASLHSINDDLDVSNENSNTITCSICLADMTIEKTTISCGHQFHSECIIEYFRRGNDKRCPYCRDDKGYSTTQQSNTMSTSIITPMNQLYAEIDKNAELINNIKIHSEYFFKNSEKKEIQAIIKKYNDDVKKQSKKYTIMINKDMNKLYKECKMKIDRELYKVKYKMAYYADLIATYLKNLNINIRQYIYNSANEEILQFIESFANVIVYMSFKYNINISHVSKSLEYNKIDIKNHKQIVDCYMSMMNVTKYNIDVRKMMVLKL